MRALAEQRKSSGGHSPQALVTDELASTSGCSSCRCSQQETLAVAADQHNQREIPKTGAPPGQSAPPTSTRPRVTPRTFPLGFTSRSPARLGPLLPPSLVPAVHSRGALCRRAPVAPVGAGAGAMVGTAAVVAATLAIPRGWRWRWRWRGSLPPPDVTSGARPPPPLGAAPAPPAALCPVPPDGSPPPFPPPLPKSGVLRALARPPTADRRRRRIGGVWRASKSVGCTYTTGGKGSVPESSS